MFMRSTVASTWSKAQRMAGHMRFAFDPVWGVFAPAVHAVVIGPMLGRSGRASGATCWWRVKCTWWTPPLVTDPPCEMEDQIAGPRARRQLPPPLTRSVQDPLLPHAAMLDELLSPVGVLLWQLLQDAALWSTAEQSAREGLFADAAKATAGAVPEVEEELDALGVLVRDPHPDAGPIIARMCDRVRAWAEDRGLEGTALAFAQAAALADPENARGAYEVGRLARRRAEYARADAWYQRAAALANRSGDMETRALSFSGLANMYSQRGNYPLARQLKEKAIRLARRHSLREVLGGACHDLAILDFEAGDVRSGMRHAREALRILGRMHVRTPVVVQDMAMALMDRCAAFPAAREVLRSVLPHVVQRDMQLLVLSNLAWAAAATGDARLFDATWTEAWTALERSSGVLRPDHMLGLARGAAYLHQWDRARDAAARALALAEERKEGKTIYVLEALLREIEAKRSAGAQTQPASSGIHDPAVAGFARDLIRALQVLPPVADDLNQKLRAVLDNPDDALKVYEIGRALRLAGEYERGARWFEHGVSLAREAGNPLAAAMCLGGLGNLYLQWGDLPRALETHQRHLDVARREGLREMEAYALVDLCAVCFTMNRGEAGFAYAREALAVLAPGDALWPRLAHDLAMYFMESRGDFDNALTLFLALGRHELSPELRLVFRASLSRAAAGAGRAQLFEDTWAAAWAEIEGMADSACPSGALVQLAQGALIRGLYDLAERAAGRALRIATAQGELQMAAGAESLLATVAETAKTRARIPPHTDPEHNARAASLLTRGVVAALKGGVTRSGRVTHTPTALELERPARTRSASVPAAPVAGAAACAARIVGSCERRISRRKTAPHVAPDPTGFLPGCNPTGGGHNRITARADHRERGQH